MTSFDQHFARLMATLVNGHCFTRAGPSNANNGNLQFAFSSRCAANHSRNRTNDGECLTPADHEPYNGSRAKAVDEQCLTKDLTFVTSHMTARSLAGGAEISMQVATLTFPTHSWAVIGAGMTWGSPNMRFCNWRWAIYCWNA